MGTNNLIKPTLEWMKDNYDMLNHELFDGRLGDCHFEVFTSGRGSQGKTLGRFRLRNHDIYVVRESGEMYLQNYFTSSRKYINADNFVKYCMPSIMLNGNYSATEEALQTTLVHEMCHYYTYMFGQCPRQAHGSKFREIASFVSSRSGGRFTIKRLAGAEVMSNYQLDPQMMAKREKRIENKKATAMAIVVYKDNGDVQLTLVSNNNYRI